MTRIPIKYANAWRWFLTILGAPPRWADLRVDGRGRVRVRMSFFFRTRFDRANVADVARYRTCVSVGAHGWDGRWLVNGAHRPIAAITLREPVRARVLGFPVHLRELLVSVDDVAALRAALAA